MPLLVRRVALAAMIVGMLAGLPAEAHHPMGGATPQTFWHGLLSGLGHPVIGVDHLAFIVGIGLLAGVQAAGYGVGLSFVAASLAGVLIDVAGKGLAGAETLVAGSVLVLGIVMAVQLRLAPALWCAAAAAAGLLHGMVFAETVVGAERGPIIAYLIGLAVVQSLIAWAATAMGERWRDNPLLAARLRPAGIVLALIGASFFIMALPQA
jgi:urease accessory protein